MIRPTVWIFKRTIFANECIRFHFLDVSHTDTIFQGLGKNLPLAMEPFGATTTTDHCARPAAITYTLIILPSVHIEGEMRIERNWVLHSPNSWRFGSFGSFIEFNEFRSVSISTYVFAVEFKRKDWILGLIAREHLPCANNELYYLEIKKNRVFNSVLNMNKTNLWHSMT